MKRLIKRIAAITLAVFLLASLLAGCSGNGGGNENSSAPADTGSGGSAGNATPGNADGNAGLVFRDVYNEDIRIAYLPIGTGGAAAIAATRGLEYAVRDFDNVTIDTFDSNYDLNRQITLLNDCATQGYDAIILCALDSEALNTAVLEVEAMGIPVITQNNGVSALHSVHVAGDSYIIGLLAAQGMYEHLGDEGNVIMLDCDAANLATAKMGRAFEDWAEENTNWNIIDYTNIAQWSAENANTAMRDFLTLHDDIDAVWTAYDDIAIGAMRAIEAAGKNPGDYVIWGQEGTSDAMWEAIQSGKATGTVFSDVYDNMGTCVKMALYCLQAGITAPKAGYTDTPVVFTPFENVTLKNIESMAGLKRW